MAHLLVFTSSPTSLTGSRSGFCTVARSRAMSERLASIVEHLGVYDVEKMRGKPVFEYRKIWFADSQYHILSRICETSADYTNRSNYIAEHLVLSRDEIANLASPAQTILEYPWLKKWDKDPEFLGEISVGGSAQKFAPPSLNWKAEFADAGFAASLFNGRIAEIRALNSDGERLLKLFAESAALQTRPEKAWDYTFTTAFTKGENPADFVWKTEISDPPADAEMFADCVNLPAKTAPEPCSKTLAAYARTGRISNIERLGLKVGKPSDIKPQIHIAKNFKPSGGNKKLTVAAAACAAAAIVLAAAFALWPSKPEKKQKPFYTQPDANAYNSADMSKISTAKTTYTNLRSEIRAQIEAKNWGEALRIWDESGYGEYNPKARSEILAQIGEKVDAMLGALESRKNFKTPPEAGADIQKIAEALKIKDLKNKKERLERLQKIQGQL